MQDIGEYIQDTLGTVVAFLPKLIGAIVILLIGWAVGRILGKYISKFLDKIGLDNAVKKTAFGKGIERSGISVTHFFDLVVRWFVYLLAIMAATNVLDIEFVTEFMQRIVSYIPNIVAFILVLVVGFIVIDFLADFVENITASADVRLAKPVISLLRMFLYFVVAILALTQLKLDLTIVYLFLEPLAWGIGIGLGAAIAIIAGFGLKDRAPAIMEDVLHAVRKEEK
jgi:small-conductance mechanosensitive channel